MAERQTRWFQVPVSRDVWVQIPSSAPTRLLVLGAFFHALNNTEWHVVEYLPAQFSILIVKVYVSAEVCLNVYCDTLLVVIFVYDNFVYQHSQMRVANRSIFNNIIEEVNDIILKRKS